MATNLVFYLSPTYILKMHTLQDWLKAVRHIVTNGNDIKLCSLSQVGDNIVYNNFTVCYKQQYSELHIHVHFLPIGSIGWFSQYTRGQ